MFKTKLDNIKKHNPIDQYLIQERMAEQLREKIAELVVQKDDEPDEISSLDSNKQEQLNNSNLGFKLDTENMNYQDKNDKKS